MEDNKDHNNAYHQKSEPTDLSLLHFLQNHQELNTQGTVGNQASPTHRREVARSALVVCAGLPWPAGPSQQLAMGNGQDPLFLHCRQDPVPFPQGPHILVGLAKCPMNLMLKQYKEAHCIPRTGERFLLIRKQNLGPTDSFGTQLPFREMFQTQGTNWTIVKSGSRVGDGCYPNMLS